MKRSITAASVVCVAMFVLTIKPTVAFAEIVPLDISGHLNYDAIGEFGERQYAGWYRNNDPDTGLARGAAVSSTAYNVWGNHAIAKFTNNGRMFVSQAIASTFGAAGGIGIPADYIVGDFEIGKGMTVPDGYTRYGISSWTDPGAYPLTPPTKVNQTLFLDRTSQTLQLLPGQQAQYSELNLLFNGWRNTVAGTYSTVIEARYAGDTEFTVDLAGYAHCGRK